MGEKKKYFTDLTLTSTKNSSKIMFINHLRISTSLLFLYASRRPLPPHLQVVLPAECSDERLQLRRPLPVYLEAARGFGLEVRQHVQHGALVEATKKKIAHLHKVVGNGCGGFGPSARVGR